MTTKDRAKYLFENYLILFPEFYNDLEFGYNEVKAKQCALILVNEIIKQYSSGKFDYKVLDKEELEYWQEVKIEIEKL
jgi:hypothetical protein